MIPLLFEVFGAMAFSILLPIDAGVLEHMAKGEAVPPPAISDVWKRMSAADDPWPTSTPEIKPPHKVESRSLGVVTRAQSVMMVDRSSGKVLLQKDSETPRAIGSITKLMTAFIFLQDHPDLEAAAVLEERDVRTGGEQHLALGDAVKVRDLLHASLVGSDNTATAALVRLSDVTEEEFAKRMNAQAQTFGMRSTHFVDATGLSPNNRSTAKDLMRMLHGVLREAEIGHITRLSHASITSASGRVFDIPSTNELFGTFVSEPPYEFVGGKTGYLPLAGYSFATAFRKEGEGDVLVAVLGAPDKHARFADVKALLAWGYKVYDW